MGEEFARKADLIAMNKIATDRLEAYQQVVQDQVLMSVVTTKNGNALRKILSRRP
jgi:hypothetical protein